MDRLKKDKMNFKRPVNLVRPVTPLLWKGVGGEVAIGNIFIELNINKI